MSIYKHILGEQFQQLHPMLQKRYALKEGEVFIGNGVMNSIEGGPGWLKPFYRLGVKRKLLFPESGLTIPFTIKNTYTINSQGVEEVHWERIFYFKNKNRYFNALMSYDSARNMIKDYLGEPKVMYSDLTFTITKDRGLLIQSKGQRLVIGRLEVPLPRIFQGLATVNETYHDEQNSYYISVKVTNPLIGQVFAYEGDFTCGDIS